MSFYDKMMSVRDRALRAHESGLTEEATKTAVVLPFIHALGYDIFDPTEVVPEFTADVATKKGEKVDYAIMREGLPALLIECKPSNGCLKANHIDQLYRYFSVTEGRLAILTNGVEFHFYSDLDSPNKMDNTPFMVLDFRDPSESVLTSLQFLTKNSFDLNSILNNAKEMKYVTAIKGFFAAQLSEPDDDFVKAVTRAVYEGPLRKSVQDQFKLFVKKGLRLFLTEEIRQRMERVEIDPEPEPEQVEDNGIITTEEELAAFHVVQAICSSVVDVKRVILKDAKTYCLIYLDNIRQPLCRLYFNSKKMYVALFDEEKKMQKILIESPSDIYSLSEDIRSTALRYGD